jgi:parvulin-like peptidyl-prolyl isomerase
MKKIFACAILFFFALAALNAEVIDQPVARIKLMKTDIINQSKFMKFVEKYEKQVNKKLTLDERKQVLDELIKEKLLVQAALQDKLTATQNEVDSKINQFKQVLEYQQQKTFSMDDLKKYVAIQTDTTWDEFVDTIRNSVLQEKYLEIKKGKEIQDASKAPTEDEIDSFYTDNRKNFVAPEMLKFKQIAIVTKGKDADTKKKCLERAKEIYKDLQKGGSFDNYNEVFIKGITQQVGALYIETWQRDDETRKNVYGASFFNMLFKLNEGALSEVIESNLGYHIVQAIKKYPFAILGIDDKIPPQYQQTVRDKIRDGLVQKKAYDAKLHALDELVADLKKKAEIKIFDDKLSW